MKKIKVVQFGLGHIGIEAIKLAVKRAGIEVVGGIDIDLQRIAKSLTALTSVPWILMNPAGLRLMTEPALPVWTNTPGR